MTAPAAGPLVTFMVDGIRFALAVSDVIELTPLRNVTPVPATADRVAGVTAWRGKTIPVIDLRRYLKRPEPEPDVKSRLLIVGRPAPFGILIGEPGRILRESDRSAVDVADESDRSPESLSLIRTPEGVVRVLDPAQVLGEVRTLVRELP